MENSVTKLKDKLDLIYSDLKSRKVVSAWKKALAEAVREDKYGANIILIDFLQFHKYLPISVWRLFGETFNWNENRQSLSELFTKSIVDILCDNMVMKLPIRLELIPDNLGEDTDRFITYVILAKEYIDENQLTKASIVIKAAKAIYSKHPDLTLLDAEYALKKYDYMRAERTLDRLLTTDSENGDVYLLLGIIYRDSGVYNKAGRAFRDAYTFDCDEKRLAIESAKYFVALEKHRKARAVYFRFLSKKPYDTEVQELLYNLNSDEIEALNSKADLSSEERKRLAEAYLGMRQIKTAMDIALPIDKSFYHDAEGCLLAGHLLWANGDLKGAEHAYLKCAGLSKRESVGLYYLGKLKNTKGMHHEAMAYFEKTLSMNIRQYPAYLALGKIYIQKNDFQNAEYMANILIKAQADLANAYVLKGIVLEHNEAIEDALIYYDLAIKTDPKLEIAYKKRIKVLQKLGRSGAVNNKEQQTLRDDLLPRLPDERKIKRKLNAAPEVIKLILQSDAHRRRGKIVEAYYDIIKASELDDNDPEITFRKGTILYVMERQPEAKICLERLTNDPEYSKTANKILEDIDTYLGTLKLADVKDPLVLAEYYYNAGKRNACMNILKQLEVEGPLRAKYDVIAGKCCIAFNKIEQAGEYFTSALEKDPSLKEVMFFKAMTLQAMGKNEEALELYDKAIEVADNKVDLYTGKASLLYGTGKCFRVISMWDEIRNTIDRNSDLNGYVGLSYHDLGNPVEAEKQLAAAIEAGSDSAEFFRIRAKILNELGRYHEAIECCDNGFEFHKKMSGLYYQKAFALRALGKLRQAERVNKLSLEADLQSDESYYMMGSLYADKGMYREAVESFSKALEIKPEMSIYYLSIADCLSKIGKFNDAIEYYSEAIEIDSENVDALLKRSVLYNKIDRDEDALIDIKAIIDKDPDNIPGLIALADILSEYEIIETEDEMIEVPDIYSFSGAEQNIQNEMDSTELISAEDSEIKTDIATERDKKAESENESETESENRSEIRSETQAEQESEELFEYSSAQEHNLEKDVFAEFTEDAGFYYSRVLEIDSEYMEAYSKRGKYYIQNERFSEALTDFTKVIELDGSLTDGYMQRGITHQYLGDYKAAIEDFDRVITMNETYVSAYSNMVKCYNALYNYETAVKVANAGISVDSDFLYLYVNRGIAYYHLEKYEEAIKDLTIVIENQIKVNTEAIENSYKYRGYCHEESENKEAAVSDFQMSLKYDPDNKEVKERLNRLKNGKTKIHGFFRKKRGDN